MTSEVYYNALRYSLIQQINLVKAKNVLPYKGFTWAIYADGYGYPTYYGYEFEHLINC